MRQGRRHPNIDHLSLVFEGGPPICCSVCTAKSSAYRDLLFVFTRGKTSAHLPSFNYPNVCYYFLLLWALDYSIVWLDFIAATITTLKCFVHFSTPCFYTVLSFVSLVIQLFACMQVLGSIYRNFKFQLCFTCFI